MLGLVHFGMLSLDFFYPSCQDATSRTSRGVFRRRHIVKRTLIALALCVGLFSTSSASAKWTGSQLLFVGAADNVQLGDSDTFAMRSSVHWFWQPQTDTMLWFGYFGPKFHLADWIWMSPQVGVAGNWNPDGGDAFLTSLWTGITPHPRVFVFVENDFYVYGDGQWDYYGYYFADWSFGSVAVGPTVEQVNKNFIVGPHVTLYTKSGPWISVQYWVAAKTGSYDHMTRFVVGLFF